MSSLLSRLSHGPGDSQGRKRTLAVADLVEPGRTTQVRVTRNPRARRISLRVDPADGAVALTVPWHVSIEEGLRFARREVEWLRKRLERLPESAPFAAGAEFDFMGQRVRVEHLPGGGPTRLDGDILRVGGDAEFVARRVRDFLRAQARSVLLAKSRDAAQRIGKTVRAVRIADPRSRWGSAAHDGRLSYSWRLVLAPVFVLDYVVAHEVAHLAHMNHGPRFWATVEQLYGDHRAAKAWLAEHGTKLHRHG